MGTPLTRKVTMEKQYVKTVIPKQQKQNQRKNQKPLLWKLNHPYMQVCHDAKVNSVKQHTIMHLIFTKLHITMLNTTSMISVQTKKSLLSSALLFPNLLNVKKVAYLT